jgi:hypothetical protein
VQEYRFKADEWRRRTTSEQIYRCRLLSQQAYELCNGCSPEVQRAYRDLAHAWTKLAIALESTFKGGLL